MIGKAFDVPRVEAKKLIISIGFGGSLSTWASKVMRRIPVVAEGGLVAKAVSWLRRLEDSKTLRECEAVLSPEARQWRKERNLASKCFSVYQDAERALLDRMQAAAGARLVSLEHDGVAVYADAAERVRDACGSTHVKTTPMPKWEEFAAENFDWSVASDLHFLKFAALKERCRRHVRSSRARQNNADFARLVVANLKPVAHVPAEFGEKRTCLELFASTGFWETRHKDDLVVVVSDILKRLMRPGCRPPGAVERPVVCELHLQRRDGRPCWREPPACPDGDRGRDKILFSDGVLLNLPDLSQRKGYVVPHQPSDIFDQVLAFLETRAQGLEDNEQGRKVIESFQQLASDGCELVTLLRRYGSYNWVLWLLRFFTRAASGVDRHCEFLHLFGPGSSGKDVLLLILLRFLGREDNNYGAMLPGSYVAVGGQSDKNGPTENIAQLVDFLKAYAEQGGAPITGRTKAGLAGLASCDDTLKARIAKGMFSPQLLFFVKGLYTLLGPKYNPGMELIPKPAEMRELEIEMAAPPGDDNKPSVNSFLAAKCERAATQSHATPFNDLLKAVKLFLGLQGGSEGRAALHRAGIRLKGVGTRRVAVGAWSIKQG
ncbi:unnamed protein product [Effrenium voratum]|uniref:Uncharacterized protein n=1 Tax=Effrenium voratum TaxID=2562239 RepID=A0AA36MN14_9DINO|nr:unnamed protein product [Effrenium voratum]